jgi:hypothetical protein
MVPAPKPAWRDPEPGYYPQDDGSVALVRISSTGNWYAIGVTRRPDGSLAKEYLGRHTRGLVNPVSLEEATEHLCRK